MNNIARRLVVGMTLLTGADLDAARRTQQSFVPIGGFVPDAVTACRIAEAVLLPVYGREVVQLQMPLSARLQDAVWTVEGRLPHGASVGGVALVKIAKKDGAFLHMSHGR